jgi:hypothetical protein
MDEMGSNRSCREWIRRGAVLLLIFSTLPAQASPIRQHQQHASSIPRGLQSWVNFLSGGPGVWSRVHAPLVTSHVRHLIAQEMLSPDPTSNPMVNYLEWRRNLKPARFDHWHPHLGPALQNLLQLPNPNPQGQNADSNPNPNPNPNPGPGAGPGPGPSPGSGPGSSLRPEIGSGAGPGPRPVPAPIPEPSTWTMALALVGAGFWWRHRTGRSLRPSRH